MTGTVSRDRTSCSRSDPDIPAVPSELLILIAGTLSIVGEVPVLCFNSPWCFRDTQQGTDHLVDHPCFMVCSVYCPVPVCVFECFLNFLCIIHVGDQRVELCATTLSGLLQQPDGLSPRFYREPSWVAGQRLPGILGRIMMVPRAGDTGFEPVRLSHLLVFKTSAISHSANHPQRKAGYSKSSVSPPNCFRNSDRTLPVLLSTTFFIPSTVMHFPHAPSAP